MRSALCGLILFTGTLIMVACKRDNSAEISKADSLLTVLKQTDSIFVSINKGLADSILNLMDARITEIQQYPKDSLSETEAAAFNNYLSLHEPLKYFIDKHKDFEGSIMVSRKQIETLKEDLKNQSIDEEKMIEFMSQEEKAVGIIQSNTVMVCDLVQNSLDAFTDADARISEILSKRQTQKIEEAN